MFQLQHRHDAAMPGAQNKQGSRSSVLNSLRGMSYNEGAAALSPNSAANVQRKGRRDKPVLPEPIEALGLKKVTVIVEPGAWEKLSESEQQSVLNYLSSREAHAKKSKKTRGYTVTIGSKELGPQTDDQLATVNDQAEAGTARMDKGRAPKHRDENPNSYIGVNPGKVHIKTTEIEPDQKPDAANFETESTFPSAKYKPEDMNNEAFNKTLETAAAYMRQLREQFGPDVQLSLTVESGESLVTPPEGMVTGDLARLRAETAIAQATAYFEAQGIDTSHIDFGTQTHIGTTPYIRGVSDPDAQCYTDEQFLRVTVEMSGEPQPEVKEERSTEAEVITLDTKTDLKHSPPPRRKSKKSRKSRGPSKRQKRRWRKHAADC